MLPEIKPADKCAECRRLEADLAIKDRAAFKALTEDIEEIVWEKSHKDWRASKNTIEAHRRTCPHWREQLHERDA